MKKLLFGLVIACCAFMSCTENQIARKLGGSMEITLKPGEKLMMATWKDDNLFYLTEPMDSDYVPKVKTLHGMPRSACWKQRLSLGKPADF